MRRPCLRHPLAHDRVGLFRAASPSVDNGRDLIHFEPKGLTAIAP
jgi:hypothetical protein